MWIVSLPRAGWAGGGEALGGAAGRPPRATGEGDAGGQEDGVPPTGKSCWLPTENKLHCCCVHTSTEGKQTINTKRGLRTHTQANFQ